MIQRRFVTGLKRPRNASVGIAAGLGWCLAHNCAVILCCFIVGCNLFNDALEIVNDVTWFSKGMSHSCICVAFCDQKIEGDLHVEFLGEGLLVSKWISTLGCYEWYYINLRNRNVVEFSSGECPDWLKELQRRKKQIRSYCLTTLIGENKIDADYSAFIQECSALKLALSKRDCGEGK